MSKTWKDNPFELSPDQKAERVARARAERIGRGRVSRQERWDALGTGEDGRVLNLIMDGVDKATRDGGPLDQMAEGAGFADPDAEIGALAAGVSEKVRDIRSKLGSGPSA